jgi:predicted metal-dependent phosphoesterase TrpH
MPDFVDLHCHSTASDGSLSPAQVVHRARANGLAGLSLTDHDTVAGVAEAADEARRIGLPFISGIEISCDVPKPATLHMLGYGVDPRDPVLLDMTRQLVEFRNTRNPRIVRNLNELGVHVTLEEWQQEAGGQVLGRPHLAAVLVRKGYVSSVQQAFDKYLAQGSPAYADKERLAPDRAIQMIHEAGGLAVLAHPVQLRYAHDAQLVATVRRLGDAGLDGIETIHSHHTPELTGRYSALADELGLLKTGGSDFHGESKEDIELGLANGMRVPRAMMDALLDRLAGQRRKAPPSGE